MAQSLKKEINTAIAQLPTVRPDFGPTQVRSEDDLVVGRRYRAHSKLFTEVFTMTSRPFYRDGDLWIDVVFPDFGTFSRTQK
jgi:hypothetical protein